jgi:hypothetical protein
MVGYTFSPMHLSLSLFTYTHIHTHRGQQTIRSYWRNYYEQTDGLIWVIDSADTRRLKDCKAELQQLLEQEVCVCVYVCLYVRVYVCLCVCLFVVASLYTHTQLL